MLNIYEVVNGLADSPPASTQPIGRGGPEGVGGMGVALRSVGERNALRLARQTSTLKGTNHSAVGSHSTVVSLVLPGPSLAAPQAHAELRAQPGMEKRRGTAARARGFIVNKSLTRRKVLSRYRQEGSEVHATALTA